MGLGIVVLLTFSKKLKRRYYLRPFKVDLGVVLVFFLNKKVLKGSEGVFFLVGPKKT